MSLCLWAILQENYREKVWTVNSDGTLTPELMAVNPESTPKSRAKVETVEED